jgi:hypothetical protein
MVSVDAYYITGLENELVNIDNSSLPSKDKLGKIGERFVKYGLKYYLWNKGFKVRSRGERTFKIEGQYRVTRSGVGGIDFRLQFVHSNKKYDCYVEVKNWAHYKRISNAMFNTEILSRFTNNASQSGCIWIVTMNKRNIPFIRQKCQQNNIHIIPMEEHITTQFLTQHHLTYIMEKFLDDYSNLLNNLTGKTISNVKRTSKINQPGTFEWDLEIGIPYDLVAAKYGKSVGTLRKEYSKLRSQVIDLPDRRSREWRGMQFMPTNQLDSYMAGYIEYIRNKD